MFADPLKPEVLEWAERGLGAAFTPALARRDDILAWLHRLEGDLRAMDGVLGEATGGTSGEKVEEISLKAIGEDDSPVVKLVEHVEKLPKMHNTFIIKDPEDIEAVFARHFSG